MYKVSFDFLHQCYGGSWYSNFTVFNRHPEGNLTLSVWRETSQAILYLFQEVRMGCEQVLIGRKLMQCLPSPEDVKMVLEVYKLSLEIEGLDVQTWSWAPVKNQYISFPSLPFKNRELGTFLSLATLPFRQCYYLLKKYLYSKDLWYFLMPLIVWNYWWFIFFLILSFCFPGFGHMAEIITCQKFSVFVFTLIPLE